MNSFLLYFHPQYIWDDFLSASMCVR